MDSFTQSEIKNMDAIWGKVEYKRTGGEALVRLLLIHHSNQKPFSNLGDLSSVDASSSNAKVTAHGEKILQSVGEAMKHLDNLDQHVAEHSQYYSSELLLGPANFVCYKEILTIVLARNYTGEFTPEVGATYEKVFNAMNDALSKAITE